MARPDRPPEGRRPRYGRRWDTKTCWTLLGLVLGRQLIQSFGWTLGRHNTRSVHAPSFPWIHGAGSRSRHEPCLGMVATGSADGTTQLPSNHKVYPLSTPDPKVSSTTHSMTLSPLQILHPYLSPPLNETTPVPLFDALQLLRDACRHILRGNSDWHRLLAPSDATFSMTLRLQIPISHPVDPLAWLHAQQQAQPQALAHVEACFLQTQRPPAANVTLRHDQGTGGGLAVATLFQAVTYRSTTEALAALTCLPPQARLYGGARFEEASHGSGGEEASPGNEWAAFGNAMWMLPGIELKVDYEESDDGSGLPPRTTLAVHLVAAFDPATGQSSLRVAAEEALRQLSLTSTARSPPVPCTTLPPILSRESNYRIQPSPNCNHLENHEDEAFRRGANENDDVVVDGQELFERGLERAVEEIQAGRRNAANESAMGMAAVADKEQPLSKVVLARKQILKFAADNKSLNRWIGLDVIRRWSYGGHEGGHLFYLRTNQGQEFFGCTPERLFRVHRTADQRVWVQSEALAGTRPRGSSPQADDALLQDLVNSQKDQNENRLTGQFIQDRLRELQSEGLLICDHEDENDENKSNLFVRRLLHLQHLCQRFSAQVIDSENTFRVISGLLQCLHPTPAVCGLPVERAKAFIRRYETTGFDRGFYSGPIGYLGKDTADVLVAIRSGLSSSSEETGELNVHVFAGVGIVSGSNLHDEWAETNYKLDVLSSMFPQSPMTLTGAPNANIAWSTAFVEELIRNGVTQFFVCPGSRSTPLVVAIARAVRTHVGVVHAVSVHDERAAGFRALGYARGCGRPAVVVTSSGTAVANLYPSIVEAGMDGVPMVVLTADRPYENRNTGANQAIDQVKIFSSTYVRWFRDILPPDHQVPVSLALSDAAHAVDIAMMSMGPVHINVQFRENLAPDAGPIRNDNRASAVTEFRGEHFTDAAGFHRWSSIGDKWMRKYVARCIDESTVNEIVQLVSESKRGIIVVGNVRTLPGETSLEVMDLISSFAQRVGFPIFAGAQAASLRFRSRAVIPFAEHILKCPEVADNLQPDLIIQIGAPLVSTGISSLLESAMKDNRQKTHHILIHPGQPAERADPSVTVTYNIETYISPFLEAVSAKVYERECEGCNVVGSQLCPLVLLGRRLQSEMKAVIRDAAASAPSNIGQTLLTEPEIIMEVAGFFQRANCLERSLFVSNSMPIRDCEFFLYPFDSRMTHATGPAVVGTNRGASGIDGIIASAHGLAESSNSATTLLVGDLATLHDLTSLHALSNERINQSMSPRVKHPLTIVVVNNDGGGIFSFLPIAKHGSAAGFSQFFETPTSSFSYADGGRAFGLQVESVTSYQAFQDAYSRATMTADHRIIETVVAGHDINVAVHREITQRVNSFIRNLLTEAVARDFSKIRLPLKLLNGHKEAKQRKNLVLLHGWMGDKSEWEDTATSLTKDLVDNWNIIVIDLPGHGDAPLVRSADLQCIRTALRLEDNEPDSTESPLSIDTVAATVLNTLSIHHDIESIDAIAGYSFGGRVAIAMKRLCDFAPSNHGVPPLMRPDTKIVLIGTDPHSCSGDSGGALAYDDLKRIGADANLAGLIDSISRKAFLDSSHSGSDMTRWSALLDKWYSSPIWGDLKQHKHYQRMLRRRSTMLDVRGMDMASVLELCSPPKTKQPVPVTFKPGSCLLIAGKLDPKYSAIAKNWPLRELIDNAGHSLLIEAPTVVAEIIESFLREKESSSQFWFEPAIKEEVLTRRDAKEQVPAKLHLLDNSNPLDISSWPDATKSSLSTGDKRSGYIKALSFVEFAISLANGDDANSRVNGIGWGEAASSPSHETKERRGYIIQVTSDTDDQVGIGEICPLYGLHPESHADVMKQIKLLQDAFEREHDKSPRLDVHAVMSMNGALQSFMTALALFAGIDKWHSSVYSGMEMAVVSLASQIIGSPVHGLLLHEGRRQMTSLLPINGLVTRGLHVQGQISLSTSFPSVKVKVGHQSMADDLRAMSVAYRRSEMVTSPTNRYVRADANRAWNESQALDFALSLEGIALQAIERTEFIEEPLKMTMRTEDYQLAMESHVASLEKWYRHTGLQYALDETLAELVHQSEFRFDRISETLSSVFAEGTRGCAAFVLKPSILGLEGSFRIAKLARQKLGIAAVFSSSFDSGVGLAYTAFLAAASDKINAATPVYAHGLGTFALLSEDTLSPSFASYVNKDGLLNVAAISRAVYGLCLDDMRELQYHKKVTPPSINTQLKIEAQTTAYESSTSSNPSGQISVIVSLPLPFSAQIAAARFTDLPQQSRWSPWISSVSYQGKETKWTLNVKGIPLTWRARSRLLVDPLGIEWESVSGLSNRGSVEFVPTSEDACVMTVQMTLLAPRMLRPLFRGTSLFLEEFLRDKLLRWSLEMFRDVVKADLALERGDVELGDALYSAVEGKASAIEATLNPLTPSKVLVKEDEDDLDTFADKS